MQLAAIHINICRLVSINVWFDEHLTETPPPNQAGAAVFGLMLLTGRLPFLCLKFTPNVFYFNDAWSRGRGGRNKDRKTGRSKLQNKRVKAACEQLQQNIPPNSKTGQSTMTWFYHSWQLLHFCEDFFSWYIFLRIGSWNTESSCCLLSTSILISPARAVKNTEGAVLTGMMHLYFSCCLSSKNLSRRIT